MCIYLIPEKEVFQDNAMVDSGTHTYISWNFPFLLYIW